MNNAGITTQYGFLFQRKAFILFALENAGTKQTFTFEGRDDIEISADESIYSVKSADASYIQVKSGTISESCFCKVICNWLLFDKESSGTVTLFAENQLDTLVSNITKDIIFDYIIQGKEKKRSSIAWKTYNKFQNLIETDREAFLGIIEKFLQIINIHICSMDELDSRLEKVFFENYCRDITEYQLAKSKRLERFISYILVYPPYIWEEAQSAVSDSQILSAILFRQSQAVLIHHDGLYQPCRLLDRWSC